MTTPKQQPGSPFGDRLSVLQQPPPPTTPKQPATELTLAAIASGKRILYAAMLPNGDVQFYVDPVSGRVYKPGDNPDFEADDARDEIITLASLLALREALTAIRDAATSVRVRQMAEAALADTAPAAAEIEARIRADERRKWDALHGWVERTVAAIQEQAVDRWLASPEAEQRLLLAIEAQPRISIDGDGPAAIRAILAALREQPATEEAE